MVSTRGCCGQKCMKKKNLLFFCGCIEAGRNRTARHKTLQLNNGKKKKKWRHSIVILLVYRVHSIGSYSGKNIKVGNLTENGKKKKNKSGNNIVATNGVGNRTKNCRNNIVNDADDVIILWVRLRLLTCNNDLQMNFFTECQT